MNNCVFYVVSMGDLEIEVPNGTKNTKVLLHDALHMPDISLMVVSIGQIAKSSCAVQFEDGTCKIQRGGSWLG